MKTQLLILILLIFFSFSSNAKKFECKTISYSNATYFGQYYNNDIHGYGIYKWKKDKDRYVGSFKKGLKDGYGFYYWNTNSYYYGQWKDGKRTGYGVYVDISQKLEGLWKNGKLEKSMSLNSTILIYALDAVMKAEKYC